MEGSEKHACPSGRVDLDHSPGSSERARGHNCNTDDDRAETDQPKYTATTMFESATYTYNADDSGFVEMCHPVEDDDKGKSKAGTCVECVVDYQYAGLVEERHNIQTTANSDYNIVQRSDLSLGHSTIASMLNALPLNLVRTEPDSGDFPETIMAGKQALNIYSPITVPRSLVHDDDDVRRISYSKSDLNEEGEIENNLKRTNIPEDISKHLYSDISDSDSTVTKEANLLSDMSDDKEAECVDKNNNSVQLVPKYSDISEACVSDTETVSTASSSDEEPIRGKEINQPGITIKSRRKSPHPRRSAVKEDPRFKGVTVWLQTTFRNGISDLHISAFYSNVKVRSARRAYPASQSRCSTPQCYSISDQEGSSPTYLPRDTHVTVKTCSSCKTRRTPLWRDAEDGTPLCNACGIRYKKYRLRCGKCWHIPKKEVKTYPNCPVCGGSLRYSFHKKTW